MQIIKVIKFFSLLINAPTYIACISVILVLYVLCEDRYYININQC